MGCVESSSHKKKKKVQELETGHKYELQEVTPALEEPQKPPESRKFRAKIDEEVLSKYEVKALIGRGSFSSVMRIEHRGTHQPFALKLLKDDHPDAMSMFYSELRVLQRVKHPNIIQLFEVFAIRARFYLVLQLCTGGELLDRILQKGHFTELDAVRCVRMVLEGLRHLHSLGITHRDLKCENLIFYHPGDESPLLITDLGFAHTRTENPFMHTVLGSPYYISPELLAKRPYCSGVDLWALGVITFILLSGDLPFEAETKPLLFRQILRGKFHFSSPCWSHISLLAKNFVDGLLQVDPAQRLTASGALRHPWLASGSDTGSGKNLHRFIKLSQFVQRHSTASSRSSSRSTEERIRPEDIDLLHEDPLVQAELSSLSS